jgi:hypothetical protein
MALKIELIYCLNYQKCKEDIRIEINGEAFKRR